MPKPSPKRPSLTPEELLAPHSPEVRQVVEALRSLMRVWVPEAKEVVYPGWKALGYRHPACGYFVGLFPLAQCVRFLFEWGVMLEDPEHILKGEGKQVRYLDLHSEAEIPQIALHKLVKASLMLK